MKHTKNVQLSILKIQEEMDKTIVIAADFNTHPICLYHIKWINTAAKERINVPVGQRGVLWYFIMLLRTAEFKTYELIISEIFYFQTVLDFG